MNAVAERPRAAPTQRRARPMPHFERAVVSQNIAGEWMCNGVVAHCDFGSHEGMARHQALALDVAALIELATPAERERIYARGKVGVNSIEEGVGMIRDLWYAVGTAVLVFIWAMQIAHGWAL